MNQEYIQDIAPGYGGTKHYRYYSQGLRLYSKRAVRDAIEKRFIVLRYDKITGKKEMFNHKRRQFEEVND